MDIVAVPPETTPIIVTILPTLLLIGCLISAFLLIWYLVKLNQKISSIDKNVKNLLEILSRKTD
ncbi:MAG: hypothetical protein PWP52_1732 [Bacteroidales bacterium]|jgi:Tfp pilus assembly protein PilW|nr:hypothetical protein [Bacteroidales bacterium]